MKTQPERRQNHLPETGFKPCANLQKAFTFSNWASEVRFNGLRNHRCEFRFIHRSQKNWAYRRRNHLPKSGFKPCANLQAHSPFEIELQKSDSTDSETDAAPNGSGTDHRKTELNASRNHLPKSGLKPCANLQAHSTFESELQKSDSTYSKTTAAPNGSGTDHTKSQFVVAETSFPPLVQALRKFTHLLLTEDSHTDALRHSTNPRPLRQGPVVEVQFDLNVSKPNGSQSPNRPGATSLNECANIQNKHNNALSVRRSCLRTFGFEGPAYALSVRTFSASPLKFTAPGFGFRLPAFRCCFARAWFGIWYTLWQLPVDRGPSVEFRQVLLPPSVHTLVSSTHMHLCIFFLQGLLAY